MDTQQEQQEQQEQQKEEDQKGVSLNDLVNSFRDAVALKNRLNDQVEEVNAGVSKTIDDLRTRCDNASEDAAIARSKMVEAIEHIMYDFADDPDKYMHDTTPKIAAFDNTDCDNSEELVIRMNKFLPNLNIVAVVSTDHPGIYARGAVVKNIEVSVEVREESGAWTAIDMSSLNWEDYGNNVLDSLSFFFAAILHIFQDEILPDYIPNAMYKMEWIWPEIRKRYWRMREHVAFF